jgi:hypothetical protein
LLSAAASTSHTPRIERNSIVRQLRRAGDEELGFFRQLEYGIADFRSGKLP